MELQEIDDRLKKLEKEIKELESQGKAQLLMENLLQEQEKLIKKVCEAFIYFFFNRNHFL